MTSAAPSSAILPHTISTPEPATPAYALRDPALTLHLKDLIASSSTKILSQAWHGEVVGVRGREGGGSWGMGGGWGGEWRMMRGEMSIITAAHN